MQMSGLLAVIQGGNYISFWKVIPVLVLLWVWARLMTWVDKDAQAAHLPRLVINSGLWGGLVLAFALFFFLPGFFLGLAAVIVLMIIEAVVYLVMRQKEVGLADLKQQWHDWLHRSKNDGKTIQAQGKPGELQILAANGSPLPVPAEQTPERAVYDAVQTLLVEPLRRGLERLDLTHGDGAGADGPAPASVRYFVDGFPYSGRSLDRRIAAEAVTYLKAAAGLDIADKRKPQAGLLRVRTDKHRTELRIQTAGSAAGESMRLTTDPKNRHNIPLDQLGLSADQHAAITGSVAENSGVVLVAAPKGQGQTTLLYSILRAHDAFLQHVHTIERAPEDDLEGVTQNKLPRAAAAAEEIERTGWVISQQPDVILISEIQNPQTARALVKYALEGKRVYVGLRAAGAFDALAQWRKLVGDDKLAMKSLNMVIAGRVARRLCNACKLGYQPDPETLRKLNMDPQRVGHLFQERKEPVRDAKGRPVPCEFCHDLRFKGRVGIYEVMAITDDIRQVIGSGGSTNQLRAAFRKQHGKFLQESALEQVEQGVTSVHEVLRVLRNADGGSLPAAARSSAATPRSQPRPSTT